MELTTMYESLGVSRAVYEYGEMILDGLRPRFEAIDRTAEYNQTKVLAAMQKNKLSAGCFAATTGYGYDDMGREVLEKVYADCFHTEAALVRPQITCGTHALAVALSANLLPGDELLSPNGAPYDTLEEVIGIRPSKCSLMEYGVQYRQVDLLPDGTFDFDGIRAAIGPKTKLITIQRSKGYATRPSFSVAQIGELIAFCKQCKPDVLCMVDNCYGEFVERAEPSDVGADMIVGSLIKNPGGGLAPIGGYICGTAECVERCAYRLSAPGLGQEVGANLGLLPSLYEGFFLAPNVVSGALKGAIFAANVYERLGFRVVPNGTESRHDIIQAVELGSRGGDAGLLPRHSGGGPGRQLCDPRAVGHAGLRRGGRDGGGRVRAGLVHRAVRRRPHPRTLRGLFPGRPDVAPRQARHSDEPAEARGRGPCEAAGIKGRQSRMHLHTSM